MNVLVNRGPSLMPDVYRTKMIFTMDERITAGSSRKYTANSIFDPEGATSAQPLGYDQMIALFDRYKVAAAKIHITVINHVTSDQLAISLYPSSAATAASTPVIARSQPYARAMYVGVEGSGQGIKTISSYMATKSIRGAHQIASEGYGAVVTASPSLLWFFYMNFEYIIGGSIDFTVQVKMTQWVTFYRRDNPAASVS